MSLKQAHCESCKAEGLTDAEIEKDWEQFEKDYEAWVEDIEAREAEGEETGGGDRCVAAAREIGLPQAFAETCEDRQHGCPGCPFKK